MAGTWGPFKLIQKVGQGAFGEVYRAFDTTLEREVALKLLLPRGRDPETEAKALLKEARALAKVRHPNVVPVYGVDRYGDRVGFWSDFVKGKTLSALLVSQGPFGPKEAALIGIDLCKAVGAVHGAGLLHRDIKSGNAMREEGGRILLMDFGLTHQLDEQQDLSGTPTYMAPELLHGAPATVSSDIYALGILLFHLLTGKYPAEGASFRELREAHEAGKRRTLLDERPDLSEPLSRVIDIATDADPKKRYASAGQMISALSEAMGVSAAPEKKSGWFRYWMLAPIAVAIGLALPPVRNMIWERGAPAAVGSDYDKASDFLAHYYKPKALDSAIELLKKTVAADPKFAPGWADLSRAYLQQYVRHPDKALADLIKDSATRALEINSQLASVHVTLGRLYRQLNQYDLASDELEKAKKIEPLRAETYAALAEVYEGQGRITEIEPALKHAIELDPMDWRWPDRLGYYYGTLTDKVDESIAQHKEAVRLTSGNGRALNNLGLAYRRANRLDEAEKAFRAAIQADPDVTWITNLGMLYSDKRQYAEAARTFAQATDVKPDDYRAWGFLAAVYKRENDPKAKETYLKAIQFANARQQETPKDLSLLVDRGVLYAAVGMEKESIPLLRQAAAIAPDRPEILFQVGAAYEVLHHRDEALDWIGKAIGHGYPVSFIERDSELSELRSDSRYRALINPAR
jgi:serine/threonine protein kinase